MLESPNTKLEDHNLLESRRDDGISYAKIIDRTTGDTIWRARSQKLDFSMDFPVEVFDTMHEFVKYIKSRLVHSFGDSIPSFVMHYTPNELYTIALKKDYHVLKRFIDSYRYNTDNPLSWEETMIEAVLALSELIKEHERTIMGLMENQPRTILIENPVIMTPT